MTNTPITKIVIINISIITTIIIIISSSIIIRERECFIHIYKKPKLLRTIRTPGFKSNSIKEYAIYVEI